MEETDYTSPITTSVKTITLEELVTAITGAVNSSNNQIYMSSLSIQLDIIFCIMSTDYLH